MMYYAAFDLSVLTLGTITLTRTSFSDVEVDLDDIVGTRVDGGSGDATIFFHPDSSLNNQRVIGQDPDGTVRLGHYANQCFGDVLEDYLQLVASLLSWTDFDDISVFFVEATGVYTISSTFAFGITFSSAAGAQLLGFSSQSSSSATSHESDIIPTYAINTTLPSVSLDTPNFEPRGIANHVETDTGAGGGSTRSVTPLYRRWRQEYETKEKTLRTSAESTHPWTLQHMREWCRGEYAFMVVDGFGIDEHEVFSFRSESTSWDPQRHGDGNDLQYWVDFDCVVEGTLTEFTPV